MSDSKRRSNYVEHTVSYAAVGASQAPDLMKYPPTGSTPFEHEVLLGSGEDRFMSASSVLMTWGAQRAAGITVQTVEQETEAKYRKITFRTDGVPEGPGRNDQYFAPDGTPYLEVGQIVHYTMPDSKQREMRVLSTIDEERRVGFIVGTSTETDITGEEFLSVEFRADQTVWAVARGFLYDERTGGAKLITKNAVKVEIARIQQQLVALTPVVQAVAQAPEPNVPDNTDVTNGE